MSDRGPLRVGWIGAFFKDYRAGLCEPTCIFWALPRCAEGRIGPLWFSWQWYPKRRGAA